MRCSFLVPLVFSGEYGLAGDEMAKEIESDKCTAFSSDFVS